MTNYLSVALYGVGGLVAAGVALLVAFQDKLVYVPVIPGLTKSYPFTPDRLHLLYEDVWLTSSDGVRLHSWFIKFSLHTRGPTILFFQENAGNIAHRLEMVRIMLQRLQCNVFMLSYRGYGASDGLPSQQGITRDAQAALDYLIQRTDIDTSRIIVFGRSLGGAVGALLSKNNPDKVRALILENTFTSILEMAGVLLPFLKWFIGARSSGGAKILNRFVRSPWSTIDIVGEVQQPVLFLSGLQDEMVPPRHMQMLYGKAASHNSRCTLVEFPNGMHMDTWISGGDRYWRTIQLFLKENAPEEKNDEPSHKGNGMFWSSQLQVLYNCKPRQCNLNLKSIKAASTKTCKRGSTGSWTFDFPARLMFQRSRLMCQPANVMVNFIINHHNSCYSSFFPQTILPLLALALDLINKNKDSLVRESECSE